MSGNKIYGGPRLATSPIEYLPRSAEPVCQRSGRTLIPPEIPDSVSELIVPLRPPWREGANLISTGFTRRGDIELQEDLHRTDRAAHDRKLTKSCSERNVSYMDSGLLTVSEMLHNALTGL
jgi:hypothetical protein